MKKEGTKVVIHRLVGIRIPLEVRIVKVKAHKRVINGKSVKVKAHYRIKVMVVCDLAK